MACYECICRMARITAQSQPPTLSICLRASGELRVCFCLCFCHSHHVSISIHKYIYLLLPLSFNVLFFFLILSPIQSLLFLFFCCYFFFYTFSCIYPSSTFEYLSILLSLLVPSRDSQGLVQCPLVVLCPTFPTSSSGKLQYTACRKNSAPITC